MIRPVRGPMPGQAYGSAAQGMSAGYSGQRPYGQALQQPGVRPGLPGFSVPMLMVGSPFPCVHTVSPAHTLSICHLSARSILVYLFLIELVSRTSDQDICQQKYSKNASSRQCGSMRECEHDSVPLRHDSANAEAWSGRFAAAVPGLPSTRPTHGEATDAAARRYAASRWTLCMMSYWSYSKLPQNNLSLHQPIWVESYDTLETGNLTEGGVEKRLQ